MHIDIWYKGENVLIDGGSYKYNTDEDTVKYFGGTESHNTVMLGELDQMLKGPRFIWLNWSQAIGVSITETETEFVFDGSVSCFTYLEKDIVHNRKIVKTKGIPEWYVKDEILNKPEGLNMRQLWHSPVGTETFEIISKDADKSVKEGWSSLYYGVKENTEQTELITNNTIIETTINIKK